MRFLISIQDINESAERVVGQVIANLSGSSQHRCQQKDIQVILDRPNDISWTVSAINLMYVF